MINCIYNKNTGFIYGYFPTTFEINEMLVQYPDSDYITIEFSQIPPRKEVGQWVVDLNTKQLTKL